MSISKKKWNLWGWGAAKIQAIFVFIARFLSLSVYLTADILCNHENWSDVWEMIKGKIRSGYARKN